MEVYEFGFCILIFPSVYASFVTGKNFKGMYPVVGQFVMLLPNFQYIWISMSYYKLEAPWQFGINDVLWVLAQIGCV